jgi:hypothetical protein
MKSPYQLVQWDADFIRGNNFGFRGKDLRFISALNSSTMIAPALIKAVSAYEIRVPFKRIAKVQRRHQ